MSPVGAPCGCEGSFGFGAFGIITRDSYVAWHPKMCQKGLFEHEAVILNVESLEVRLDY